MNASTIKKLDFLTILATYVAHFIGGLTVGFILCAIHIQIIAANLEGKHAVTVFDNTLWWPVVGVTCGLIQARMRPIKWLLNWRALRAMTITLFVAFLYCAFMMLLAGMAGYC